jgi:ribosomal protein S18 acetylase RimI-like enzyme
MKAVCIHDQDKIAAFLRRHPFLHLYSLGDLDDFFWHYTTWYAFTQNEDMKQLALLYTGTSLPVLLGLTEEPTDLMKDLVRSIIYLLPRHFYAHLSRDVATVLADDYEIRTHGLHYKMALTNLVNLNAFDTSDVIPLSVANKSELEEFYRVSYPGNWFEPRMLETGYYYGIRRKEALVSVAGVHIYSQSYKVAALGNIATHPLFRGQGLAGIVCAKLCQELSQTVDYIGLNVKADNSKAIACYTKLGFECIATYEEYSLTLNSLTHAFEHLP